MDFTNTIEFLTSNTEGFLHYIKYASNLWFTVFNKHTNNKMAE